ncbi:MAG: RdgB/HAM1 family non-canonical purine NTP pyrophosphatase [Actinobacteria bacterium]|uniref:dITP/XTP pyrophosphatase n=1 Tax=freshwater metagenome TaxID=449393 RepID=A0A6J6X025_9ZZZZ|nr:RdgB/HAM1 family non-canonical purine NTP pyrophosphatase [Actinomycetota bacterium]
MRTYVLATANPDKAQEIRAILDGLDVTLIPRPDDVPEVIEDGETLEDNALLKARALCEATGMAAIADDTGLFVDALNGAPGVYSARYAGEDATYADNCAKMLRELTGVDAAKRTARFRTVAAVAYPDGSWFVVDGEVEGHIAEEPRGENGFGYDPIFVPEGTKGRSMAQLAPEEKHALSHRGNAFRALADAFSER